MTIWATLLILKVAIHRSRLDFLDKEIFPSSKCMGHYIINNLIKENPKLGPLQMCISNQIDSFFLYLMLTLYQLFKTYIYLYYNSLRLSVRLSVRPYVPLFLKNH